MSKPHVAWVPAHPTYEAAREHAQAYANRYDQSMGIETGYAYAGAPAGSEWYVRFLPRKADRYGVDARTEAVEPEYGG